MIVAQLSEEKVDRNEIYRKIRVIKDFYGIKEHYLERIL
jgi:hypothetical protein